MKISDIRKKSVDELKDLLKSCSKKIAEIQFHHARARSKNVKESRELRRDRARILTLLREKKL